eukprot:3532457-Amphidinium_carterae.1
MLSVRRGEDVSVELHNVGIQGAASADDEPPAIGLRRLAFLVAQWPSSTSCSDGTMSEFIGSDEFLQPVWILQS